MLLLNQQARARGGPWRGELAGVEFHPFGWQHALGLALVAGECLLVKWLSRWPRITAGVLSAAMLLYVIEAYAHRWGVVGWGELLPLQLCDLVLLLALTLTLQSGSGRDPWPLGVEWLFLFGCGLSVFALLTPDLHQGFPSWRFFEFFLAHGIIFMAATFVLTRHGVPSRAGAPTRALAALTVYAMLVGTLDWCTGWNYGYLARKPLQPSPLDWLGRWPIYVGVGLILAWLEFTLLWWLLERFRPQSRAGSDVPIQDLKAAGTSLQRRQPSSPRK